MEQQDIRFGNATVPAHAQGGWALPGGGTTHKHAKALAAAADLDALMGCTVPMTRRPPAEVYVRPVAVVTRRTVRNFAPVYSRV
jgi:hypothetical protein